MGVYLECRFRAADKLSIRVSGRDEALISSGEDNLIWQTAVRIAGDLQRTMPTIELQLDNQIPLGKGLGSSAAALAASRQPVVPSTSVTTEPPASTAQVAPPDRASAVADEDNAPGSWVGTQVPPAVVD